MKGLIRKNILALKPYSTARDEYQGELGVFLDANENPFDNEVNRYPSMKIKRSLLKKIADLKSVPEECLFLGNGSDEAIDLCYRMFCNPGEDNAIIISPSYGMYQVCAEVNDVECRMIPLSSDFSLPVEVLLGATDAHSKLMFICSPNNPTANAFPIDGVKKLIDSFQGMVVVDEAYVDFSQKGSVVGLLSECDNLIVLQTLSKAYAMAGLRIGLAISSPEVIKYFNRVKYPYNIGSDTLKLAERILSRDVSNQVEKIVLERERLSSELSAMDMVEKVFPSDANFLLVCFKDPQKVFQILLKRKIIVRDRTSVPGCEGCLRITVGTAVQNNRLLQTLRTEGSADAIWNNREAVILRSTSETSVRVAVNLEGGKTVVSTGLNFFDHMLEQIGRHAEIGLEIDAKGDLEVDEHHTMEDVAITLGEALLKALGDKSGLSRYGFALPMDESEALVLLDFGGRIDFEWDVTFTREYVGDTPTEMFKHFFASLCASLQCNLHISAKGENNHHLAEAIFKAFARSLRAAISRKPFDYSLPSTKGIL